MRKIILSIFSLALLSGLFACSDQNEKASITANNVVSNNDQDIKEVSNKDVREVIWGQLSSQQKDQIDGTWENAKVSRITLNKNMMNQIDDKTYEGKEVYLIDFPTKQISKPNNMIVYADVNTFVYIGNGLVD